MHGLKLDMLTLCGIYLGHGCFRPKCQTREADGTMGYLIEHA